MSSLQTMKDSFAKIISRSDRAAAGANRVSPAAILRLSFLCQMYDCIRHTKRGRKIREVREGKAIFDVRHDSSHFIALGPISSFKAKIIETSPTDSKVCFRF